MVSDPGGNLSFVVIGRQICGHFCELLLEAGRLMNVQRFAVGQQKVRSVAVQSGLIQQESRCFLTSLLQCMPEQPMAAEVV
ncbi:hypothetical protein D3C81_1872750 [compost metagenome]